MSRPPTPQKMYFLSESGHKLFPLQTGHVTQATNPRAERAAVLNASTQEENLCGEDKA